MYRNFLRLQAKDLVSFRLEMFCSPSYSVLIRETLNVKEISVTVKVNMTTGGVKCKRKQTSSEKKSKLSF